jgi:hypothetical protein
VIRDRLIARMAAMGPRVDYQALAREVLALRVSDPVLARKLVEQALVIEDRQEAWRALGARACRDLPAAPGVYIMRDAGGRAVYVGKAANLRRRVPTYFAARQWRKLPPELLEAQTVEWEPAGSELEALLREALLLDELAPPVNAQMLAPRKSLARRTNWVRDLVLVLPSIEADSAELVCARTDGAVLQQRTRRDGRDLLVHGQRVMRFFRGLSRRAGAGSRCAHAPIVFAWLTTPRGRRATRLDPHDARSPADLRARLHAILSDRALFEDRIDQRATAGRE